MPEGGSAEEEEAPEAGKAEPVAQSANPGQPGAAAQEAKAEPKAESDAEPDAEQGEESLSEVVKRQFGLLVGLCAVLGPIAAIVALYVKSVVVVLLVSAIVFVVAMVVLVSLRLARNFKAAKFTASAGLLTAIVLVAIGLGVGVGYAIRHTRSDPSSGVGVAAGSTSSASPSSSLTSTSTSSENATTGFTAEVAWTDDGAPGQIYSTNLKTFTGPNTIIQVDTYRLGDDLTVICEVPNGRAIQVGPDYKGPNARSTVWYELDDQSWVPAVYVHVDSGSTVPACN